MEGLLQYVVIFVKIICDVPVVLIYLLTSLIEELIQKFTPMKSLDGETILITGVSSGIGYNLALQLSSQTNYTTLVLWDINEPGLLEVTEKCRKLGAKVIPYLVDLSNREDVEKISEKVRDECGPITILINNAAVLVEKPFLDASPEEEERVIKINFMAHMWAIRKFLPDMVKRGKGHLVSTISALGFYRWQNLTSYIASKYAIRGFLESLRLEMRQHPQKPDIKISSVYPAFVHTPMLTNTETVFRKQRVKLFEPLDSWRVAEKIIEGIRSGKSEIMIPRIVGLLDLFYRIFPSKFFDEVESLVFENEPYRRSDAILSKG